jgi:pimeloyl-ACP methyl ester carboxylesterase
MRVRQASRAVSLLLVAVLLGALAAAAWLRWRDPLAALPTDPAADLVLVEERLERWEGRLLRHLTFRGDALGTIRIAVSLPDPPPAARLPVMIVVAGLATGADNVRVLAEAGPNAVIGFDWPIPRRIPRGGELARRLPELYDAVLSAPGQVDAIVAWATRQPWAEPERISLLGFSLGALVGPAAQRLVEERGGTIGWTVLAYGGAPIGALIEEEPRLRPAWLRPVFGSALNLVLRPVEPSIHLPNLSGPFLLLGGRDDRLIPREAAERMRALTPPPSTVVLIEGGHIGIGERYQDLLDRVVAITRDWLVEQGAIEPPAP